MLAWGFAEMATRLLGRWAQIESSLAPDRTVMLFTLAVLALAGLLFGLAPLQVALAGKAELAIRTTAAASHSGAGKSRVGKMIVVLQMTLCVVLLVGAGLLIRTLRNLENTSLGMRTDSLVVFGVNPNIPSLQAGRRFYVDLMGKLRFLPGVNPLGHTFGPGNGQVKISIIGVVKNHKYRSIDEQPIPMAWYMYAQIPVIGAMNVEMRVHGDPLAILPAARKVVQQLDPNLPLIQPMTQRAQFDTTVAQQILFARLAGFFGFLAIVLVGTGLYGTLAYRVGMRTPEIGVRMAVGARREQVVWMVLKDSVALTIAGVVIGVPLAMLVGRALASSLYGIKPLDAVTYLLAVAGVAAVALVASAIPAGRATSIDPMRALRVE